jgi:hypothetical protein
MILLYKGPDNDCATKDLKNDFTQNIENATRKFSGNAG